MFLIYSNYKFINFKLNVISINYSFEISPFLESHLAISLISLNFAIGCSIKF